MRRDKTLIGRVSTEITRKRPPQRHNPDGLSLATPKRKRTYNTRRIKATWPYSVQEIHFRTSALQGWRELVAA